MHLHCTKKVLDFLKPDIEEVDTDNDLYVWHVNYSIIDRKKLLVFMNDLTRFTVVLYGVRKSDFKDIPLMLNMGIHNAMQKLGFTFEEIQKYFDNEKPVVTFSKTKNRKLVARLNKSVEAAEWGCYDIGINFDVYQQDHLSDYVNGYIIYEDEITKKIYTPKSKLREYIDML